MLAPAGLKSLPWGGHTPMAHPQGQLFQRQCTFIVLTISYYKIKAI